MPEESKRFGRILIVDDDEEFRLGLKDRFVAAGYRVLEADSCADTKEVLKTHEVDLVLLDIQLQDGNGLEMLEQIKTFDEAPEVIVLTGHATIDKTVEAMKKGAWDFVPKHCSIEDLEIRVVKACQHHGLKRETVVLKAAQKEEIPVVGRSKEIVDCLDMARQLANTDRRVLILGETGTGKEVLARFIHAQSGRAGGPFLAISCTNLTAELAESELFGHERGAFTGASHQKLGKVELAHGGTLFFDEIGDAPPIIQAKLLRFLETGEYERLGSNKNRQSNVRILAATNRDLLEDVKTGGFRKDLFYRLNVMKIMLPPLRDRKQDILDLTKYFLTEVALKTKSNELYTVTDEAQNALIAYDWPGNIRELRNVIDRATALCDGRLIRAKHLQLTVEEDLTSTNNCTCHRGSGSYHDKIAECEKKILTTVFKESNGNKNEVARRLGLHRTHLVKKLRALGLLK
ncbi:MAG: sigma-54-dependent Fis family transcriptional regulator [Nitrospirae bacterium]|nr:sigma-54-dependent Fis family transcriptional regulator [Candidatus Manganitrophaceae bacterium]